MNVMGRWTLKILWDQSRYNILLPGALLFIYYILIWVQYMFIHNLKNKMILLSIPESCTTPAGKSIYIFPYLTFDFKGTL